MREKLDVMEKYLNNVLFFRANKSELVNMMYISAQEKDKLYLDNNRYIKLARNKGKEYLYTYCKIKDKYL